ncbi:MAG: hypothetical protein HJJLKODD_00839 [Phycisphaerae bacterium]|nr:hypothetical protein [Phycisphaerae bacterium]
MMESSSTFQPCGAGLLLRVKALMLRNHLAHVFRETPLKIVSFAATVLLIWYGLFILFAKIFELVRQETFQGIVAVPLILDFFFLALMVMLVFSNGVISYGNLFARQEPAYLLSQPIRPTSLTLLIFLESVFLSSWSLLLIGLPLMVAMSTITVNIPWYYYPLFLVFFLCFIPIPGAIGLLAAWLVAVWFSRVARRLLFVLGAAVVMVVVWWVWGLLGHSRLQSEDWLKLFFERAGMIQWTFWPSRWVSQGLNEARNGELADAAFYLWLTFCNGIFFSWLVVKVVGRRFLVAYDRVQAAGGGRFYLHSWTGRLAPVLFWYLPPELRQLAWKDMRTFLRDPTQWTQLLILLGLLVLYVWNIPNIPLEMVRLKEYDFQLLISFLNLAAISLIMATFTSRFVFPLVSMELQQMWLVGLLPMKRSRVLIPKLAFALSVSLITGEIVMGMATLASGMSLELAMVNMLLIAVVCVALCGLAVGMGARLPMPYERNPAKIANGLGGTINLIVSLAMVVALLVICFFLGVYFKRQGAIVFDTNSVALMVGIIVAGLIAAAGPMWVGGRYFAKLEV